MLERVLVARIIVDQEDIYIPFGVACVMGVLCCTKGMWGQESETCLRNA